MRLRVFIASSLDGYIAGPDDDVSWIFHDGDYGFGTFYASIHSVLVGRRTFERSRRLPAWPYAGRKTIVFTRNSEYRVVAPDTVATSRSPGEVVAELRSRDAGD